MKKEDITALSLEQLQARVTEEQSRLAKLNFAHAVTPLENPNQLRNARKDVARLLTAITQKQAEASLQA
jgi:large subunit ribosomal protein L29